MSESDFLTSYNEIKIAFKNVTTKLNSAITYEEQQNPVEAAANYVESIRIIDETFTKPVGLPDNVEKVQNQWLDACSLIEKMKSARSEALYRIKVLKAKYPDINIETGNDVRAAVSCETYKEIMNDLRNALSTKNSQITFETLFQSTAKLYKIQPNGIVSTIKGDTNMSVVVLFSSPESQWKHLNGTYFIQCSMNDYNPEIAGSSLGNTMWVYALIPSVTNLYRTDYGAFILPDMESLQPEAAFGIIIPDENDLRQFLLDLLEAILAGELLEIKEPLPGSAATSTSAAVSKRIVTSADFIARNLIKGAEKTGELMMATTPYLISKMSPAPADAPPVSSKVQTSVEVAKSVTSVAAGVTGWVAGKVGSASMSLGRYLAPHIQTQGAALLEKGFGYHTNEANEKVAGALTIAAGAVEGFSTVYNGLEESAKILGTNLSNNSVKIIEHKYGPSAAGVASDTFETLGNAFNVTQNVNYITPKGIAKGVAKKTGKAVLIDYNKEIREESQYVPAGNLYPDLRTLKENSQNREL